MFYLLIFYFEILSLICPHPLVPRSYFLVHFGADFLTGTTFYEPARLSIPAKPLLSVKTAGPRPAWGHVKSSGNFGPSVNETVRSRWIFFGQSGPLSASDPGQFALSELPEEAWNQQARQVTSHLKSPRTTGNEAGPLWPLGPARPKIAIPFSKVLVSSPTLLSSSQNLGRNVNGSLDSIGNFPFSLDNPTGF